jgi:hypothetical protein
MLMDFDKLSDCISGAWCVPSSYMYEGITILKIEEAQFFEFHERRVPPV